MVVSSELRRQADDRETVTWAMQIFLAMQAHVKGD